MKDARNIGRTTRRGTLGLSAGALAAMALPPRVARAAIPAAAAEPPRLPIESGASLRVLRPARFVEPDEVIFRENAQSFSQRFNVPVRLDFVSWEDLGAQTAVASNTGSGPDIVIGWGEYPAIYADKLVEVSDVAEYLGKKYGGWLFQAEKHGKRNRTNNWIARAVRRLHRPDRPPRVGGQGSGLRRRAGRPRPVPPALPGAEAQQQARRLRARQRGGRRQRLRQLAGLGARRLPGGRGRQGRHQQPGDDRGAELPEGAVPHLHLRHAGLERRQQQPRLRRERALPHRQRHLALLRAEEGREHRGAGRRHRARAVAVRRGRLHADAGAHPERHGVQALALPERREGVHPLHDGGGAVRPLADRLPRLLVAPAERLRPERGVGLRPEARGAAATA